MIRIQIGNNTPAVYTDTQMEQFKSEFDIASLGDSKYSVIHNNKSYEILVLKVDAVSKTLNISINGTATEVKIAGKMDLVLEKLGIDKSVAHKMKSLKAPMPGLVVEWFVREGDTVMPGDKLLVLEAMKMENIIKSTGEGIVKKCCVEKGNAIEKGQLLIEFS